MRAFINICNFSSTSKLLNRYFDHFTFRKCYFETSQNYTSYEQIITDFRGKYTKLQVLP